MEFFGINGTEFVLLALLAVIILGPEKLPEYAQKLAHFIKGLRGLADGAREKLREEAGDEIADMDWRKLDPRQYDPRKIIREALMDDEPAAPVAARPAPPLVEAPKVADAPRLEAGAPAPFDNEAT